LSSSLLITGASQLLTLRGRGPRRGKALSDLGILANGVLLIRDGVIAAVGTRSKVEALPEARAAEKIDVGGRVVRRIGLDPGAPTGLRSLRIDTSGLAPGIYVCRLAAEHAGGSWRFAVVP